MRILRMLPLPVLELNLHNQETIHGEQNLSLTARTKLLLVTMQTGELPK